MRLAKLVSTRGRPVHERADVDQYWATVVQFILAKIQTIGGEPCKVRPRVSKLPKGNVEDNRIDCGSCQNA